MASQHRENAQKHSLGNTIFPLGANLAKTAHSCAITRKGGQTCTSCKNLARSRQWPRSPLGKLVGPVARGARFFCLKKKAPTFSAGTADFGRAIFRDVMCAVVCYVTLPEFTQN